MAGGSGGRRGRCCAHTEDLRTLIRSWTSGGRRPGAEAASDWPAGGLPLFLLLFAFYFRKVRKMERPLNKAKDYPITRIVINIKMLFS